MVTKDFLKEVFAKRKSLILYAQLRPVSVPHYDELSVVSLIVDVMGQASLAKLFPDQKTKAGTSEREYFFIVINTGSSASTTEHST
jgi:hypothetical protein